MHKAKLTHYPGINGDDGWVLVFLHGAKEKLQGEGRPVTVVNLAREIHRAEDVVGDWIRRAHLEEVLGMKVPAERGYAV